MNDSRELTLNLTLDAPRDKVWRCWTEAELLMQWFAPKPWSTVSADIDLRPGGRMNVVMRSPTGEDVPTTGVYLEIVPPERLVTTDAYTEGWLPSQNPFMTSVVTFADAAHGQTAYRAVVRHWRTEDRKTHEDMGFHDGWTAAARQLEALARTL